MQALRDACDDARAHIMPNPPAMDLILGRGARSKLHKAARVAVKDGVSPAKVYCEIAAVVDEMDEPFPNRILKSLIKKGLNGNSEISPGVTLLHHLLSQHYPPPCQYEGQGQAADGWSTDNEHSDNEDAGDGADNAKANNRMYLTHLLKNVDPAIKCKGDTALHLLVLKSISKFYFPDSQSTSECMAILMGGGREADLFRDDARAEYLEEAFGLFLEAGFNPEEKDSRGKTVVDYLQEGYKSYARAAFRLGDFKGAKLQQMADTLVILIVMCDHEVPEEARPHNPVPANAPLGARQARMPFGKHTGKLLSRLTPSYVQWMCRAGVLDGRDDLARHMIDLGLVRQRQGAWVSLV